VQRDKQNESMGPTGIGGSSATRRVSAGPKVCWRVGFSIGGGGLGHSAVTRADADIRSFALVRRRAAEVYAGRVANVSWVACSSGALMPPARAGSVTMSVATALQEVQQQGIWSSVTSKSLSA